MNGGVFHKVMNFFSDFQPESPVKPSRPDVIQLAGGGALVFWKPVPSKELVTYCIQYSVNGKNTYWEYTSCIMSIVFHCVFLWCFIKNVLSFILGVEWRMLAENVTDSCYTVNALPRGPGYMFRVSHNTKTGLAPFSDPSPPAFMATPYEGTDLLEIKLFI